MKKEEQAGQPEMAIVEGLEKVYLSRCWQIT
jgi:hypothetical protein